MTNNDLFMEVPSNRVYGTTALRKKREALGIKAEEIAVIAGVSCSTVLRVEKGTRHIDKQTARKIQDYLSGVAIEKEQSLFI